MRIIPKYENTGYLGHVTGELGREMVIIALMGGLQWPILQPPSISFVVS